MRCSPILPAPASKRDCERIVLGAGVGDFADRLDVLPRSGIERVLGVGDGRDGVFCVEGDLELAWCRGRCRSRDCAADGFERGDCGRRGVDQETVAHFLAFECVGGSVGRGVRGDDFDLIAAIGNQRCIKAIGLIVEVVL